MKIQLNPLWNLLDIFIILLDERLQRFSNVCALTWWTSWVFLHWASPGYRVLSCLRFSFLSRSLPSDKGRRRLFFIQDWAILFWRKSCCKSSLQTWFTFRLGPLPRSNWVRLLPRNSSWDSWFQLCHQGWTWIFASILSSSMRCIDFIILTHWMNNFPLWHPTHSQMMPLFYLFSFRCVQIWIRPRIVQIRKIDFFLLVLNVEQNVRPHAVEFSIRSDHRRRI